MYAADEVRDVLSALAARKKREAEGILSGLAASDARWSTGTQTTQDEFIRMQRRLIEDMIRPQLEAVPLFARFARG